MMKNKHFEKCFRENECQKESEAIVPDKIIKVATGNHSLSVVVECVVGKKEQEP